VTLSTVCAIRTKFYQKLSEILATSFGVICYLLPGVQAHDNRT